MSRNKSLTNSRFALTFPGYDIFPLKKSEVSGGTRIANTGHHSLGAHVRKSGIYVTAIALGFLGLKQESARHTGGHKSFGLRLLIGLFFILFNTL